MTKGIRTQIDNSIILVKLDYKAPEDQLYSDEEIKIWLKNDKLNKKSAEKLAKLLKN